MKEFIKKILKGPITIINKIVIGSYLHLNKNKAQGIKKMDFFDEKILIISPHQDDEIIGCGCLIHNAIEQGCSIKTVFISDGSKSSEYIDRDTMKNMRKVEALRVAEVMKMEQPIFIDREDGVLDPDDENASKGIKEAIFDFKPNIIMLPYFLDGHKDHTAISGMFLNAIEGVEYKGKVYAYEINSPISVYGVTDYIDCTESIDRKSDILKYYKSQTMSFESILLMNKLNRIIAGTMGGAELFREINLNAYKKAYKKYNEDNNIWIKFRQMYSIYFMIIAYFKGLRFKKEITLYQDLCDK